MLVDVNEETAVPTGIDGVCGNCGRSFVMQFQSGAEWVKICVWCLAKALGAQSWIEIQENE